MDELPKPEVILRPSSLPKIPIIISGVILLLAIILGLKYFNFPKTVQKSNSPFKCPVDQKLCKIATAGSTLTYSKLASGSAVLAMIDGQLISQPPNFTITNSNLGIKITYEFNPKAYTSSGSDSFNVKQGAIIGYISKDKLVISAQNLKSKENIKLDPNNFLWK